MIEPVTVLLTIAGTLTLGLIVVNTAAAVLNNRALAKAHQHLDGQDKATAEMQVLVDGRLSTALAELEQSRAATLAVSTKLDIALARIISLQEFIDRGTGAGAPSDSEGAAAREERAAALIAAAQLAAAQLTATAQVAADKVLAEAHLQSPSTGEPRPVRLVAPATLAVRVVDPPPPIDPEEHVNGHP